MGTWLLRELWPKSPRGLLLSLSLASGAALLLRLWLRGRRLPPGPRGLPLLGCWRLRDQSRWHATVSELAPKYPGLFSFRCGSQLVVAVTSFQLLKEMLESSVFAGRETVMHRISKKAGLVFNEGERWQQHRRTSLRVLRDFGFARPQSAEMVYTAMARALDSLDSASRERRPVRPLSLFCEVSNSVIAQLLFGRQFSPDEPDFAQFCETARQAVVAEQLTVLSKYPIIGRLLLLLPLPQELKRRSDALRDYVASVVEERRRAVLEQAAVPTCLCDLYIQEASSLSNADAAASIYDDKELLQVCIEFFIAGTDTTARSVEWAMLYLALHPQVQEQVHRELDDVVGQARPVQLSDRPLLHYTNAVIDECYRLASIVACGLLHRALEDADFQGFLIPSDAVIMPHIYAVHHDPQLWPQPHQFRPDRFLDEEGRYKSSQHLIPFLVGKRACLGESLARMEVFLMITLIMQRYSLSPTPDTESRREHILSGKNGFLLEPNDYDGLLFMQR